MDKKSNRTDLLAAGRKKLQQYRQKKDNKVKDGKGKDGKGGGSRSSSEADKSKQNNADADANLVSATDMKAQISLSGTETESSSNSVDTAVDSQMPFENSEGTYADSQNSVDISGLHLESAENPLNHDQDSYTSRTVGEVVIDAGECEQSRTSEATEFNAVHVDVLAPSSAPAPEEAYDAEFVATDSVEEKGLLVGDQVSVVGAMQEADSVDPKQPDRNVEFEFGRNEESSISYAISEKSVAPNPVAELSVSAATISETIGDYETVEVSIPPAETTPPLVAETTGPKKLNWQEEDATNLSTNEDLLNLQSFRDSRYPKTEENQAHLDQKVVEGYKEAGSVIDVECHKDDVESHLKGSAGDQSLPLGVKSNSLDLDQLALVLQGLPEDDFKYVIRSREVAGHGIFSMPKNEIVALPEIFQEQHYLANILKDIFHLQLLDQHKQQTNFGLSEVPALTALLTDVQESNSRLGVELAQCRSELEVIINEKLNFQKMCHSAKEERVELFATVDELKNKLNKSVTCISSVSAELVNCKVSLEVSEIENENLFKSLASMSEQRNKFEGVMQQYFDENQKLLLDMNDSSTQLAALEQETDNLKISLASMTDEKKKLEEEKKYVFHEKELLSGDLAECRSIIAALNQENSGLNTSLAALTEESKKLKDHEEFLAQEFERLSTELVVFQDKVSIQQQERVQLEAELKEAMSRLEQMAEENIFLHSSLEIYKARITETGSRQIQLPSVGTGSKGRIRTVDTDNSVEISMKEDTEAALLSVAPAPGDVSDDASLNELQSGSSEGALILKGYMKEAEKIMQKLGKAVDGMHSHSVSLSRSFGKSSAPGVSKLIQAFESKGNTDDHEPEESPLTESEGPLNPYFIAKEQLICLEDVLHALAQNAEVVDALIKKESSRREAAIITCGEREAEAEALKGMRSNFEARNIELEVICGALDQHAHDTEAKKNQLEDLCEALKRQYEGLESHNIELVEKLTGTHSRVNELQVQLKEIRKGSCKLASTVLTEVEIMQREMKEGMNSVEKEWNSLFSELVSMVEKLETVVRSAVSYPLLSEVSQLDVIGRFSHSVSAACEVIEHWKSSLEAHDELSSSYRGIEEKLCAVNEERSLAIDLLQKFSADLVNMLNSSDEHFKNSHMKENNLQDPLDASFYEVLVANLGSLLGDKLQLKELNSKLSSDLSSKVNEIEKLKKQFLDTDTLQKLVLEVKEVLKVHNTEVDLDEEPVAHLQSSIFLLIQKYKELEGQASLSIKDANSRVIEFDKLQGYVELLNSLIIEQQNNILVLTASMVQAKDGFDAMQAELLQKAKELEQSEQRVASVREKLSIAVAKGKGLVVQRDNLKQSLADMSIELEKCSDELQLKDSGLLETEEKLKDYLEAGERMEALESELTYIRNSATALRESFYLKDSTLQKIEEIFEDLELPEYFHSKDVIEKVDWLAKTVAGNSLPPGDWDQSSVGGSYSDAGFIVTDGVKEDVQPTPNMDDDLRRKYEELQTKFYEVAEQNDMLEQSLMERNILVQRWEEILDRINTPTQIRSMEPEERIHWLGTALSEADHHMRSLQQKIENLENYCESLSNDLEESQRRTYELESSLEVILHEKENALSESDSHRISLQQKIDSLENYCSSLCTDLEDSQRKVSELRSSLQAVIKNKEVLSCCLVTSTSDCEIALYIAAQNELERDSLRTQVKLLQENLANKLKNEDQIDQIESDLKRLQRLILDVLQDSRTEDESSDASHTQVLEGLIRKLVNHVRDVDSEVHVLKAGVQEHISEHAATALMVADIVDEHVYKKDISKSSSSVHEGQNIEDLRQELAEALDELVSLREERDVYLQKSHSVEIELKEIDSKKEELLELLNQEEQKSASLREKLNLAVRKGKSVVQQRDGLKQNIEEMTATIDKLKLNIKSHEDALVESEQKISDLTVQIEMCKAFEAENISLKNHLVEAEQHLQQNSHTLNLFLSKLGGINVVEGNYAHEPLEKLEVISKRYSDLQHSTTCFEQEAKKSKKSAELLLAELNEVQERNDGLQEELERAFDEITNLSKERDLANSAKFEALSHLDNLSKEKEDRLAELERLKATVHGMKKVFLDLSTLSDDMFVKDLELLRNVRAHIESYLELGVDTIPTKDHGGLVSINSRFKDFFSRTSAWGNKIPELLDDSAGFDSCEVIEQHLQQLTETISDFKERINEHSMSLRTEAEWLSTATDSMIKEVASQRSSVESIKDEKIRLESIGKEKDMEVVVLRRSITLLYDACTRSILEIESRKAQLAGETFASEDLKTNLPALLTGDGVNISSSEESVKDLADKLLMAVDNAVDIGTKGFEGHSKELKTEILDLHKQLDEKDIQREQICMELVSQIKEAEATTENCSQDMQSMKNYAGDLESKLEALGKDKTLLEQRVSELQLEFLNSTELGEKVQSLTSAVAAKEQEIEVLMQALEEEENQMEAMRSKIDELENAVQHKNADLEHVEASRAKAHKKLSVTVSKFDELHHMSEGLLSEIENLQTQLQDRDSEISFLRQEATRCTNDVLEATKMAKERSSGELREFLEWLGTMLSGVLKRDMHDGFVSYHPEYKEHVQREITTIISELEDLRVAAESKDTLLEAERNKMKELSQRKDVLEALLNEKEQHLNSIQSTGVSGLGTSEIVELEPMLNKRTSPAPPPQVRSLRKVNNDQVSIAIDTDAGSSGRLEDEDDDKVHGFKSLTTSRFVPKFTRPVNDMIDGLWVSCDRALMRQPALRLGIMIYWAVLHAFLASFIV